MAHTKTHSHSMQRLATFRGITRLGSIVELASIFRAAPRRLHNGLGMGRGRRWAGDGDRPTVLGPAPGPPGRWLPCTSTGLPKYRTRTMVAGMIRGRAVGISGFRGNRRSPTAEPGSAHGRRGPVGGVGARRAAHAGASPGRAGPAETTGPPWFPSCAASSGMGPFDGKRPGWTGIGATASTPWREGDARSHRPCGAAIEPSSR